MRVIVAAAVAALVSLQHPAPLLAQVFPSRPITIIMPYGSGSVPDLMARAVAGHMQAALGQPVVVEAKPGAGGAIGTAAGRRAPPDGYTLTLGGTPAVMAMEVTLAPGFDLVADFEPVGRISTMINVIAASAKLQARSVAELVAFGRANPGKLNFATSGQATPSDLGGRLFAQRHGITATFVPYRGATANIAALVSGEADVSIVAIGGVVPHVEAGTIRALAITGPKRWERMPNLASADEAGAKIYMDGWLGLLAPAGTPLDRIALLNKALNDALDFADVKQTAAQTGGSVLLGSPGDLTILMRDDIAATREMVGIAGIAKQ
jgi:tripartite-type tricarboxylate transporter receptor subunit TctC